MTSLWPELSSSVSWIKSSSTGTPATNSTRNHLKTIADLERQEADHERRLERIRLRWSDKRPIGLHLNASPSPNHQLLHPQDQTFTHNNTDNQLNSSVVAANSPTEPLLAAQTPVGQPLTNFNINESFIIAVSAEHSTAGTLSMDSFEEEDRDDNGDSSSGDEIETTSGNSAATEQSSMMLLDSNTDEDEIL